MMVHRRWLPLLLGWPLLAGFDPLRMANRDVQRANEHMKAGKADEALPLYDKALAARPQDPAIQFDRGNALFALQRFDEAAQAYTRATEAKAAPLKAAAFYNRGNAFFRGGKFSEAVESYKRSLALEPGDVRAKWNLELALRKKKEEEEKNKNKDDKKGDKGDDKQDGKQDQKPDPQSDDEPDPKGNESNPDKPGQQPSPKDEAQQPEKSPPEPDKPDPTAQNGKDGKDQPPAAPAKADDKAKHGDERARELREAEGLLDGLERSPRALEQERARLRASRRRPPERDW